MDLNEQKSPLLKRWALWGWLILLVCTVASVSLLEQRSLRTALAVESSILHRLASQRADQHDAHLTSLSAIASAGEEIRRDLFLDVSQTIMRFYPRIISVDLVALSSANESISTSGQSSPAIASLVAQAARTSDGSLQLRADPENSSYYLLIKRSPNTKAAKYGLALTIDGPALLETNADFWKSPAVYYSLKMPDGSLIAGSQNDIDPDFSKPLGSASQPLLFEVSTMPSWAVLLPWKPIALAAALTSLAYFLALAVLRQFLHTRQAERKARLSALETRLAHASRVNALGEIASGLAHELTQPLTAILSQAQAGKHLTLMGDMKALTPVLDNTIIQARRASAILHRMWRWTKPAREGVTRSSLVDAANLVQALLLPEANKQDTRFEFNFADADNLVISADPVELEQIIFNLARNALDAVSSAEDRHVEIRCYRKSNWAIIDVTDSGAGIATEIMPRLFEPFATSKPGGTGLGLAICQRLAERMGGEITLLGKQTKTVFQVRLPIASSIDRVAAQ